MAFFKGSPSKFLEALKLVNAYLKELLLLTGALLIVVALFVLFRELRRDVLIIDSFNVPKQYSDAGLTGEIMADRIGDSLRQMENEVETIVTYFARTHTRSASTTDGESTPFTPGLRKDILAGSAGIEHLPDIQLSGGGFGLKNVTGFLRNIFGWHPRRVSGNLLPLLCPSSTVAGSSIAIRITRPSRGEESISICVPTTNPEVLSRRIAEELFSKMNPLLFASYQMLHDKNPEAIETLRRMEDDESFGPDQRAWAHIFLGGLFSEGDDSVEAIAQIKRAIDLDPLNSFAFVALGNALGEDCPYEGLAALKKAIEIDPQNAQAYQSWGDLLAGRREFEEASAKYQKAIDIDPRNQAAYLQLGDMYEDTDDLGSAFTVYQKATSSTPKPAYVYMRWGEVLKEHGSLREAIAKFEKSAQIEPRISQVYLDWGNALLELGKEKEAVSQYEKAAKIDPEDDGVYYLWSKLLAGQGKLPEAISMYQRQASRPKGSLLGSFAEHEAYMARADVLAQAGRIVEAVTMRLNHLKSSDPVKGSGLDRVLMHLFLSHAFRARGDTLARQGDRPKAIENYRSAGDSDPEGEAFFNWINGSKSSDDDWKRAVEEISTIAKNGRARSRSYFAWGRALEKLKVYPQAREVLAQAQQLKASEQGGPYGNIDWGNALMMQGRPVEALSKFAKAADLGRAPDLNPGVEGDVLRKVKLATYRALLAIPGKFDEAIAKYRKATELDPKDADAYYFWSKALEKQGHHRQAEEKFARAVATKTAARERSN